MPRRLGCRAAAILFGTICSAGVIAGAEAATLRVGPGLAYASIAAAVAASHDGDTIAVASGTYTNDFAEIRTKVRLISVGGMVTLNAIGNIPNQKGILITDTDISIDGFRFIGARVSNSSGGNGAGIRYQGGRLTIANCYFSGNQNGILGNSDPVGSISIGTSEFADNGVASGPTSGYTHNLYIGRIAQFSFDRSYSHGAKVGHELKSRASVNVITNSRFVDGRTGTASYSIDLPNGGTATLSGNQIEQGPASQNAAIISFGEEGALPDSSLTMNNNLIENDLTSPSVLGVVIAAGAKASINSTRIFGLTASQLTLGPATVTRTTLLASEPPISPAHPWVKPSP